MHMNSRAPMAIAESPIVFWKCGVAPDAIKNLEDLVSKAD